jgi:adenylosuccinate synthase
MKAVVMVVDMQFGSTGKGQIAGTIGRVWQPDTVVCANGPNAGHTYKWTEEGRFAHDLERTRSVVHTVTPVTSVLPSVRNILLGPGAVIVIARLFEEVTQNADLFAGKRLIIHPMASIVTQDHRDREKNFVGIGSTMKGTAEAVIEKMRRLPGANIARHWAAQLESLTPSLSIKCIVNEQVYNEAIDSSRKLMVEGAQGASLSMHSRFYPHTTSRDVGINQIWADCRLPAVTNSSFQDSDIQIIGVCRTYPIRVANRFNEQGIRVGYSGDCYPDQKEISWADIGREAELTTVTKLPRRLFTFSTAQILEAVRFNAPTSIALTFCDYLASHNEDHPDIPEGMMTYPVNVGAEISPCVMSHIRRLEAACSCNVDFVSFGPTDSDIYSPDTNRLGNLYLPWGI